MTTSTPRKMTPSRTARSHLLVTPDLIGFAWEAPVYCKVVRMGPRDVRIEGLHDAAGNTWSIKRSDAVSCTVAASEARSNTSGPLLRQAVMTEHEDAFHHGQVVSESESQVSIRLMDETLATSADNATPVAPAVALLLEELTFATSEWSLDEMVSLHHEILDRICGTNNSNGSNDISIILADLVDSASYPASEDIRTWIDPKTGELSSFPLRHAIDYVYHVDGGILPVPALVGPSFCQPPSRQPRRHDVNSASRRRPSASSDRLQLFDPELDDDDDSSSETSADATHINTRSSRKRAVSNSKRNRPVTKQRVESQQPGDDAEKDALIAQLLIDRPGLTERILQLRSDAALQTSFTHALAPAQRLLENSVQSLQDRNPAREAPQADQDQQDVKQRSKYSFVPSVTQRRIHALVTALRHQAKSVSIFLEALINPGFVLFKPFPSVLGRAFAIEFGIRGLSFMHFMPFSDLSDKAVWIATSGVNMKKKSAAVPLPAAPAARSIDDIVDALQSLATYASEYFSSALRELVDTLVTFAKLRLRQMKWDQTDLVLVVYWINSILESFRIVLEAGTSDGTLVKLRCTEDDADFRQILIHIQQRQIHDLQNAISVAHHKRAPSTSKQSSTPQSGDGGQRRVQRTEQTIPADVYAQLPVQDGKRLCLRFLSNAGCRANNGNSCLSVKRAHFVPSSIHLLVKEFITERFGGLKPEHSSL